MKKTKRGFTLIELLVVVMIIAILAAIAVPQYKHAALKSRFSTVMPMAKSIADAQEVYYQGRQMYALSTDELDVTPVNAENTSVTLSTAAEEDKYAYVAAQRSDVPGARYIVYQKYSPMFASTIQCEADENNEDALWLCEKGLNGTEISGSVNTAQGSYRTFLLNGTAGAADKLPTSISKLRAQICGTQFDGANCIVDEENNTITTQECDGTFSNGSGTRNCIKRTYDDSATQTDYVRENMDCSYQGGLYSQTTCNTYQYNEANAFLGQIVEECRDVNGGQFNNNNGECTASRVSPSEYYTIAEYDSNSVRTKATLYFCTKMAEDGTCASVVTQTYTF